MTLDTCSLILSLRNGKKLLLFGAKVSLPSPPRPTFHGIIRRRRREKRRLLFTAADQKTKATPPHSIFVPSLVTFFRAEMGSFSLLPSSLVRLCLLSKNKISSLALDVAAGFFSPHRRTFARSSFLLPSAPPPRLMEGSIRVQFQSAQESPRRMEISVELRK